MRRFVIAAVVALGFLTVGLTGMGHATTFRQTDAEGAAAGGRMSRPDVVAMVTVSVETRAEMLVANACYANLARSLLAG